MASRIVRRSIVAVCLLAVACADTPAVDSGATVSPDGSIAAGDATLVDVPRVADAATDAVRDALDAARVLDAAMDAVSRDTGPVDAPACGAGATVCDGGVCCGSVCVPGDCCDDVACRSRSGHGAGSVCNQHRCVDVAGSLSGLLWQLPCGGHVDNGSCAAAAAPVVVTATLGGIPGATYDVTLRLRGVVERKSYDGGCADGDALEIGGVPQVDGYNVYRLTISSPAQTYYLNRGASFVTHVGAIDFDLTVRADQGATFTLVADASDAFEIQDVDANGAPVSVTDTTGLSLAQPFDGQFIQMDVRSVALDPIADTTPGRGGSTLAFAGGQYVTVADGPSLRPASLTLEAWVNPAVFDGAIDTLIARPYGTATLDAYTMRFRGGQIEAGAVSGDAFVTLAAPWSAPVGEWHHVAYAVDTSTHTHTLFVDGLRVACDAFAGPLAYDDASVWFGADHGLGSPGGFLNGQLDEVRLFSAARTPDAVWSDAHTVTLVNTALAARWSCDEGSGQITHDRSGHRNDAVLGTTPDPESVDPTWGP